MDASPKMTRTVVARILGCSVATVRRLEARGQLHPKLGPRGVRLFDPVEVDQLAPACSPTDGEWRQQMTEWCAKTNQRMAMLEQVLELVVEQLRVTA